MFTFQALQILLFLIPGFIASQLLDSFVNRKQAKKELENIIEALVLSMVIYTIYSFTGKASPLTLDQKNNFSYNYDAYSFLILVGISVAVPIILALIINNDLHMKLARFFRITKKTARFSVWHDIFYEKEPLVVIDFNDGRRLFGWIEHYSDDPDKPYLYVAQPQWIKEDKYIQTGLEGILITPEQKISFIEFLKHETDTKLAKPDNINKKRGKHGTRQR